MGNMWAVSWVGWGVLQGLGDMRWHALVGFQAAKCSLKDACSPASSELMPRSNLQGGHAEGDCLTCVPFQCSVCR